MVDDTDNDTPFNELKRVNGSNAIFTDELNRLSLELGLLTENDEEWISLSDEDDTDAVISERGLDRYVSKEFLKVFSSENIMLRFPETYLLHHFIYNCRTLSFTMDNYPNESKRSGCLMKKTDLKELKTSVSCKIPSSCQNFDPKLHASKSQTEILLKIPHKYKNQQDNSLIDIKLLGTTLAQGPSLTSDSEECECQNISYESEKYDHVLTKDTHDNNCTKTPLFLKQVESTRKNVKEFQVFVSQNTEIAQACNCFSDNDAIVEIDETCKENTEANKVSIRLGDNLVLSLITDVDEAPNEESCGNLEGPQSVENTSSQFPTIQILVKCNGETIHEISSPMKLEQKSSKDAIEGIISEDDYQQIFCVNTCKNKVISICTKDTCETITKKPEAPSCLKCPVPTCGGPSSELSQGEPVPEKTKRSKGKKGKKGKKKSKKKKSKTSKEPPPPPCPCPVKEPEPPLCPCPEKEPEPPICPCPEEETGPTKISVPKRDSFPKRDSQPKRDLTPKKDSMPKRNSAQRRDSSCEDECGCGEDSSSPSAKPSPSSKFCSCPPNNDKVASLGSFSLFFIIGNMETGNCSCTKNSGSNDLLSTAMICVHVDSPSDKRSILPKIAEEKTKLSVPSCSCPSFVASRDVPSKKSGSSICSCPSLNVSSGGRKNSNILPPVRTSTSNAMGLRSSMQKPNYCLSSQNRVSLSIPADKGKSCSAMACPDQAIAITQCQSSPSLGIGQKEQTSTQACASQKSACIQPSNTCGPPLQHAFRSIQATVSQKSATAQPSVCSTPTCSATSPCAMKLPLSIMCPPSCAINLPICTPRKVEKKPCTPIQERSLKTTGTQPSTCSIKVGPSVVCTPVKIPSSPALKVEKSTCSFSGECKQSRETSAAQSKTSCKTSCSICKELAKLAECEDEVEEIIPNKCEEKKKKLAAATSLRRSKNFKQLSHLDVAGADNFVYSQGAKDDLHLITGDYSDLKLAFEKFMVTENSKNPKCKYIKKG